jgi:hypothetical protein
MKTKFAPLAVSLPLALAVLAGCGTDSVSPGNLQTTDQSQVTRTVGSAPSLIDDDLLTTTSPVSLARALRGGNDAAPAAIQPFTFWRSITSDTRTFGIAFADTDSTGHPATAVVTIHRHFTGTFLVLPESLPGVPYLTPTHIVRKPLDDLWERRVLLNHLPIDGSAHSIWRIAAVSGAEVTSQGATSTIDSIQVRAGSGLDTTIADPLAFFHLRKVMRFGPDDSVTVTTWTRRTDDVVVFYHHDRRARFTNNGDGSYTFGFRTVAYNGWRHFGVNVLSHGALFDDQAPYDSKAWILPYAVTTMPPVDYVP